MTDTLTPVLTDNWDQDRSWTLAAYESRGGYAAAKKALGMAPDVIVAIASIDPVMGGVDR